MAYISKTTLDLNKQLILLCKNKIKLEKKSVLPPYARSINIYLCLFFSQTQAPTFAGDQPGAARPKPHGHHPHQEDVARQQEEGRGKCWRAPEKKPNFRRWCFVNERRFSNISFSFNEIIYLGTNFQFVSSYFIFNAPNSYSKMW